MVLRDEDVRKELLKDGQVVCNPEDHIVRVEVVDQNREEFESWFREFYKAKIGHPDYSLETYREHPLQYVMDIPHHDYLVWKHSRSSLYIELPCKKGGDTLESISGSFADERYDLAIDRCSDAITKTGVRVR